MTYIPDKEAFGVNKELAQSIAGTSPTSVYSPGTDVETVIKTIVVANTAAAGRWFSLYIDNDGTTYDDTTKLFHEVNVAGKSTTVIDVFIAMNDSSGNLAIEAQNATDITISIYGTEFDKS